MQWLRLPSIEEHCLTEDGQAVAQLFKNDKVDFHITENLRQTKCAKFNRIFCNILNSVVAMF